MTLGRLVMIGLLAALLILPLAFRTEQVRKADTPLEVIIITPHNEQIRFEFGRAFSQWHQRRYGQPVNVTFNVPGGTSEIRKMLDAQFRRALIDDRPVGGAADLVFGGGSYEHDVLKRVIEVEVNGAKRQTTITTPVDFDHAWLEATYGPNAIGDGRLYDPDRHWFGTALSGFGIVFNRDELANVHAPEPTSWVDLCRPELFGQVALVNPGQSGSITTAFETILKRKGWVEGWRILRRAAANARYFSASSLKPPIDVTQGDAAVAICIDFYGRYQWQSMTDAGYPDRVGYVDPPGESTIDPDPISMLRNAPHPELAKRFIEFCLSIEGQSLWQFQANADARDGFGPARFELRRLPVLRRYYSDMPDPEAGFVLRDRCIDHVNPYELATPIEHPDSNVRTFIAPLFSAMAMDSHHELRRAWKAIIEHPGYPRGPEAPVIVTAADVSDPTLREMLTGFDALPTVPTPSSTALSIEDPSKLGEIRNGWFREQWKDHGLWNPETGPVDHLRRAWGAELRRNYGRIELLAHDLRASARAPDE